MLDDQLIILADDNGKPTGEYAPKEKAHSGEGLHHLAITVLIQNSKGEVLLQKRKHLRFDNIWDLTGATDLYHHPNSHNESFEEATLRCLQREYGIENLEVKNLGGFNYFAKWDHLCENEYCAIMVGEYNHPVKMNPEVGYECKWVDKKAFLTDIEQNPSLYTPWAVEAVKLLKSQGF